MTDKLLWASADAPHVTILGSIHSLKACPIGSWTRKTAPTPWYLRPTSINPSLRHRLPSKGDYPCPALLSGDRSQH